MRSSPIFSKTYNSCNAGTRVSPFERQGFPPAVKSLPVLTTLSSRFSRGTMPALFRMAFSGIYPCPGQLFTWIREKNGRELQRKRIGKNQIL